MVKALRIVVFVFGLGVLAMLLVGSFLPGTWAVEKSRSLRAPPEAVAAELQSLKAWPEWTHFSPKNDATLQVTFEGPERGAGACMRWRGDRLGGGALTIQEVLPGGGIAYEIAFHGAELPVRGRVELAPEPGGTRVTWKENGELTRNPIHRIFSFLIEVKLARDRERVLQELAKRVER